MKKRFNNSAKFTLFAALVALLALICMWEPAAREVANVTGKTVGQIQSLAKVVLGIALGVTLMSIGAGAITVPWVGVTLIALGLAMTVYSAWPLFTSSTPTTVKKN